MFTFYSDQRMMLVAVINVKNREHKQIPSHFCKLWNINTSVFLCVNQTEFSSQSSSRYILSIYEINMKRGKENRRDLLSEKRE